MMQNKNNKTNKDEKLKYFNKTDVKYYRDYDISRCNIIKK